MRSVGEAAVKAMESLWEQNIRDRRGSNPSTRNNRLITWMFDHNGWGQWLREPSLGGCPNGYESPPDPDWCGQAVAVAFRFVGDYLEDGICLDITLDPRICSGMLVSTRRLANLGETRWATLGVPDPHVTGIIMPGDVIVVQTREGKSYGDHICLVTTKALNGWVDTLEGNAVGTLPDGTSGKGLIKTSRLIKTVRQHIRFTDAHCVPIEE